jgi:hypothetical protein
VRELTGDLFKKISTLSERIDKVEGKVGLHEDNEAVQNNNNLQKVTFSGLLSTAELSKRTTFSKTIIGSSSFLVS